MKCTLIDANKPMPNESEDYMSSMPNPMEVLLSLQESLNVGMPTNPCYLDPNYKMIFDEPNGGKRYSYSKIIDNEVQAMSIFGLVEPIDGIVCFSVGYAVSQRSRGQGLAVEAVNKGIEEMKHGLRRNGLEKFYVEAVIDATNVHSIAVAKKLFSSSGDPMRDSFTKIPALYFKKLILT